MSEVVNRIISLDRYRASPDNYNLHPDEQIADLRRSVRLFGQVRSVVVLDDGQGGFVGVAGHGFIEAAQAEGKSEVKADVIPPDWTPEKVVAYMAADNETARGSSPDLAKLAALVARLKETDEELAAVAAGGDARLKELLRSLKAPAGEDDGGQVDRAAELQEKWGTCTGQMWLLDSGNGNPHRLVCGDCTDAAVVARVMGGEVGDLWLTDPPYAVSYADKNRYLNAVAFGNRIQVPIEGDHLTLEEAADLWQAAATLALEFCADHASYYWFACQGGDQMMMMMRLSEAGWRVRHELIWVKNNHVLGRTDYNYKHEPILYGWKKDGRHRFYGGFQTSVLEFPEPQNSDFHPTTKPVELVERLIINSSEPGGIVIDGFLGSGTTLLAAEKTGRRARCVEISAAYTAVCLERFFLLTGVAPVLLEAGPAQA